MRRRILDAVTAMWLTIADYGPLHKRTCEIAECDQDACYIKDDRFARNVCPSCRDFYDQWRFWPDDHTWNG